MSTASNSSIPAVMSALGFSDLGSQAIAKDLRSRPDLTPAARTVWIFLYRAYQAFHGRLYTSLAYIAREVGYSIRTVRRSLRQLEAARLITLTPQTRQPNPRTKKGGGGNSTWRFRVHWHPYESIAIAETSAPRDRETSHPSEVPQNDTTTVPQQSAPNHSEISPTATGILTVIDGDHAPGSTTLEVSKRILARSNRSRDDAECATEGPRPSYPPLEFPPPHTTRGEISSLSPVIDRTTLPEVNPPELAAFPLAIPTCLDTPVVPVPTDMHGEDLGSMALEVHDQALEFSLGQPSQSSEDPGCVPDAPRTLGPLSQVPELRTVLGDPQSLGSMINRSALPTVTPPESPGFFLPITDPHEVRAIAPDVANPTAKPCLALSSARLKHPACATEAPRTVCPPLSILESRTTQGLEPPFGLVISKTPLQEVNQPAPTIFAPDTLTISRERVGAVESHAIPDLDRIAGLLTDLQDFLGFRAQSAKALIHRHGSQTVAEVLQWIRTAPIGKIRYPKAWMVAALTESYETPSWIQDTAREKAHHAARLAAIDAEVAERQRQAALTRNQWATTEAAWDQLAPLLQESVGHRLATEVTTLLATQIPDQSLRDRVAHPESPIWRAAWLAVWEAAGCPRG